MREGAGGTEVRTFVLEASFGKVPCRFIKAPESRVAMLQVAASNVAGVVQSCRDGGVVGMAGMLDRRDLINTVTLPRISRY